MEIKLFFFTMKPLCRRSFFGKMSGGAVNTTTKHLIGNPPPSVHRHRPSSSAKHLTRNPPSSFFDVQIWVREAAPYLMGVDKDLGLEIKLKPPSICLHVEVLQ
ncbi:hypothetical protein L6164_006858 [Bauhinia variegata]|uniref:Uncharacterized protein n=1 Tax=Bauhinia variegata TaxID=167791 RepID=A0ACB9PXK3_BAUVA|nr:hypothetical protein L6164_006858 [Bauhinia variegata]